MLRSGDIGAFAEFRSCFLLVQETLEAEDKAFLYLFSLCGLGLLPPGAGERGRVCQTVSVSVCACRVRALSDWWVWSGRSWRRVTGR